MENQNVVSVVVRRFSNEEIEQKMVSLAASERLSKDLIRDLALDCLAITLANSNFTMANKLVAIMTPANRTAFVLFMKEMTGHNFKDPSFGKKDKRVTDVMLQARHAEFIGKYQGDMWLWYSDKRQKEIEEKKSWTSDALIKTLTSLAIEKGVDFLANEDFKELLKQSLNQAKANARNELLIKTKAAELQAANPDFTAKDCLNRAKKMISLATANDNQETAE